MCDNSLNDLGRSVRSGRAPLDGSHQPKKPPGMVVDSENKGDLLIRYLWERSTYFILDVRVLNTDVVSYMNKTPEKILVMEEQE